MGYFSEERGGGRVQKEMPYLKRTRTNNRRSSDHGYQLGQLNLNWDKRNLYESNIRIHLLVRGPGISPGSAFDIAATNVDLAPTLLDMAGVLESAGEMDGRSFLPHIPGKSDAMDELPSWRDHVFLEYYYIGLGEYCGMRESMYLLGVCRSA